LKILSELVLLLPNTDSFQQFEDFVRACSTFFKWSVFIRSRRSSDKNPQIVEGGQYSVEVEQALTKIFKLLKAVNINPMSTMRNEQIGDFCQSLFYFY
jgi:hypothetical protein